MLSGIDEMLEVMLNNSRDCKSSKLSGRSIGSVVQEALYPSWLIIRHLI